MLHNFETFLGGNWLVRGKHIVSVDSTAIAEDTLEDILRVLSWFRLINNTARTAIIITEIVEFHHIILFECFWKTSRL